MKDLKIPKRISTALLNSLGAGVVPRVGLEYIAVGRKEEIETLLMDLENIAEGGSFCRFIVGRYGSGKSFMLQLIRNYAMERNYAVADADLTPERRLVGTKGQGLATYRELIQNLSVKIRPEGGALPSILEKWISGIQIEIIKSNNLQFNDPSLDKLVEVKIMDIISNMVGMVHGFDFAKILTTYYNGHQTGDSNLKDSALRWLRGEFQTKTEAKNILGVNVIIDDDSWYDYLKLMTKFIVNIGYKGFLVLIDEGVNLYKIVNSVSRQSNYEKILSMFNDTMQGKAQNLGIIFGGTPQFVEDSRRGLFSYDALKSRLTESRFASQGYRDILSPIIKLQVLTHEEIFLLLTSLAELHNLHYGNSINITSANIQAFMQEIVDKLGAEELLTPREVIRDFIGLLNILNQRTELNFNDLIHSDAFKPSTEDIREEISDDFAEFTL